MIVIQGHHMATKNNSPADAALLRDTVLDLNRRMMQLEVAHANLKLRHDDLHRRYATVRAYLISYFFAGYTPGDFEEIGVLKTW